jgi:ABC-2 type transport system permease protein
MFRTIRTIIRKEFIQTFRDKRMLMPIFVAPIIQLILFGYAVTTDIKHITSAAVDYDRTPASRSLLSSFIESGYFDLAAEFVSSAEIDAALQEGRAQIALIIPMNFERNLKAWKTAPVQVILDGTDPNSATIIQSYVSLIAAKYQENLMARFSIRKIEGLAFPEPRIWYNPELKSSVYMVPGVICLILLLTTLILTSMAITRERELGTLEQIIVSPIKPVELILGKTVPFVILGFFDILLIITAGKLIFDVPIRGSLLFLFGASFIFILTSLSFGLFLSTVSRTQQQAMMTAFFFVMPAMLLSGIFSPIESMPKIVQYITYLNPLRYFGKVVRRILLKGNGLSVLWPEITVLFLFGLTAIILSSLRFRKYLE